ncbi:hypothetical protein H4582DRAFT_2064088 [Lactarius indigo]|nr:hypothetical protein H4582DRAFT_2064088 [Lactarius indigo]
MARVGIIRMNVIWTTKVGDHPENKQVSSVKSAASSPGEIIRECQNRQRNTRNTYRYGPSTRRNRPAIGRRFTTPALTHFPLAAGLDAPPSAKGEVDPYWWFGVEVERTMRWKESSESTHRNGQTAEERDGRATNAPTEAIRVRVEIAREGSRSVETSTDCQPNMSIGPSFRQPPPDRGGVHRSVLRLPLPLFKGAHSLLPIPSA